MLLPSRNLETAFHIIKGTVGTGVLALPQAFQNCGLVNGVIFMAIIGIVSTWGMHILVITYYKNSYAITFNYISSNTITWCKSDTLIVKDCENGSVLK